MKNRLSTKAKYLINNPHVIREIMNLIEEYKRSPDKFKNSLIYLAGGWPQDPPHPLIKETIKKILNNEEKFQRGVQYGPTRGLTETINSLIDYEKEVFGRKIDEKSIIIGNGSTGLTVSLINAIIDEDDEIILTKPYYLNYHRQLLIEISQNIKIKYWNLIKETYEPSIEELNNLITDKTKAIILTSPGNPDGRILNDEKFKEISDITKDKKIFLITDIAYRGFCYVKEPFYFSKELEENEIYICTLSKELRTPGLRLAYLLANEEIIKAIETIEQTTNLCPNNFSQIILAELLSTKENRKIIKEFIEKGKKLYHDVSKLTYSNLKDIEKLNVLEPQAAFYVFFNHSKVVKNSKEFCNKLLNEYQVALAPGSDFGLEGWTRLSFSLNVLNPEIIVEGIRRLKKFISNYR